MGISASWVQKGFFNLKEQKPPITQEIRVALAAALGLQRMEMAMFPVGANWKHVFWWRETKTDFAEAQFVAAIAEEYPMLSLGISVEKGRGTAAKKRPAIDPTWDWYRLLKHLPDVLKVDVPQLAVNLERPVNLRIKSKPRKTPETAGWKTRGFSFVEDRWFERHVGQVRGRKIDAIVDYISELDREKDVWVIVTFTRDLSEQEASGMSASAVADVLLKFNPLRKRLRSR